MQPNILISKEGNACIADLGLSELKDEEADLSNYSTPWCVAGHPRWQAPELLKAESKEDGRRTTESDVFSYGRVMLEVRTIRSRFLGVIYLWLNSYLRHSCSQERFHFTPYETL